MTDTCGSDKDKADDKNKLWLILIAMALVALAAVAAWLLPHGTNWLVVLGLFLIAVLLVGRATTGQLVGALINEQKLMSLSRFQIVIWMLLIVSAYVAISMGRLRYCH